MLISISGSQGSGKSKLIQSLVDRGHLAVGRKTARSILTDWGVTLQEVNEDLDLTVQYQEALLARKIEDDYEHVGSSSVWLTERTFADLFVYALISLGKHNQYSDWLNTYFAKCMDCQTAYDQVFYLTAGHFSVVNDGVRGINQHYSKMADMTMRHFTNVMTPPGKLTIVDTGCLNERIDSIIQVIDKQ